MAQRGVSRPRKLRGLSEKYARGSEERALPEWVLAPFIACDLSAKRVLAAFYPTCLSSGPHIMAENSDSNGRSTSGVPQQFFLVLLAAMLGVVGLRLPQELDRDVPKLSGARSPVASSDSGSPKSSAAEVAPALQVLRDYANPLRSTSPKSSKVEWNSTVILGDAKSSRSLKHAGQISVTEPVLTPMATADEIEHLLNARKADVADELHCLIATIPDPIDSHFQQLCDETMQAISMAAGGEHFALNRYSLVWKRDAAVAKQNRDDGSESGGELRRSKYPGALLFQRDKLDANQKPGANSELLLVLLVGETPTSGVHRPAFHAALDFAAAASLNSSGIVDKPLRILGPVFSGSGRSLRDGAEQWLKDRKSETPCIGTPEIEIRTGSATSDSLSELLNVEFTNGGSLKFSATVNPDQAGLTLAVVDHLTRIRNIEAQQIAMLCEDSTAYGVTDWQYASLKKMQELRFPFSLSDLRSEFARQRPDDVLAEKSQLIGLRQNLRLPFEQSASVKDMLPSFSTMTPATLDAALDSMLATIRRQRIKAIGLTGTDIRDKLFLARQVHDACPDIQLFTTESNILYTHADHAPLLRGMLVSSTYPLFQNEHFWFSPMPKRHWKWNAKEETWGQLDSKEVESPGVLNAFSSDTSQGTFEAGSSLILEMLNGTRPKSAMRPIWLTMIGASGIWPVDVYLLKAPLQQQSSLREQPFDESRIFAKQPKGECKKTAIDVIRHFVVGATTNSLTFEKDRAFVAAPSLFPIIVFELLTLLACLREVVPMCLRARNHKAQQRLSYLSKAVRQRLDQAQAKSTHESVVQFIGLMSWLGIAALLLAPRWSVYQYREKMPFDVWDALVLCLAGVAIVVTLASLLTVIWQARSAICRFVLTVTALLAIAVLFACWSRMERDIDRLIFAERAGTLTNGVSPITPFIILATFFCLWSFWRLKVLRMQHDYPLPVNMDLFLSSQAKTSGGHLHRLNQTLSRVHQLPQRPIEWIVISGILTLSIAALWKRWIGTAEGSCFDWGICILLTIASVFALESLTRLAAACRQFRGLLASIERHPVRSAFQRVAERLRSPLTSQLLVEHPDVRDLKLLPAFVSQHIREDAHGCVGYSMTREQCEQLQDELQDLTASLWRREGNDRHEQVVVGTELRITQTTEAGSERTEVELRPRTKNKDVAVHEIGARFNELVVDQAICRLFAPRLWQHWEGHCPVARDGNPLKNEGRDDHLRELEAVTASIWVYVFRAIFGRLRDLMIGTTLLSLAILLCVDSYPFQPHSLLLYFGGGLMGAAAAFSLHAIWTLSGNSFLRTIQSDSQSSFSFASSSAMPILALVVTPIASIITVLVPSVSSMVFGWFGTVQKIVGG